MDWLWWLRGASAANIVLGVVLLAGCGGPDNVAPVTGTVTLDGAPLAGALVRFHPQKGGSPSAGVTDESGRYALTYTRSLRGAEVGDHWVTIGTFAAGDPDADPPRPAVPEKVPAQYNSATRLTAAVKSGSNQIDFPLEGSGPVVQPPAVRDE